MLRHPLTLVIPIGAVLGMAALVWLFITRERPFPTSFELNFTATGLVEEVTYQDEGRCTVQVAAYDWISLSQGFEWGEIPQQDEQYYLQGEGEACQALNVAIAATQNHIGFKAGRSADSWYLVEPPKPATGCGGLAIDWAPEPL